MNEVLNNPLVSIIIPVFNGADFLNQAIDSALAQTYQNIEVIVVNDGSSDKGATEKIARSYGNKIYYYQKENGGVATALNFGISKMKGKYFSWLSHDDLYTPDKIETQVAEVSRYDDKTILYSDYKVFRQDSSDSYIERLPTIDPKDFRYWITFTTGIHGCTLLIPKSAFDEYGVFDASLKTTQDYAMWFNLAKTYKFIHIPNVLISARIHQNQGTQFLVDMAKKECDDLIKTFIDQLEPHEITHATKMDLQSSYFKIAKSCRTRGFIMACNRANELAEQQTSPINKEFKKMETTAFPKAKSLLKKFIPLQLFQKKKSLKDKFTHVYRKNIFGGKDSRSGEGSDLIQTAIIRKEIPRVIKEYGVYTFLDAPCGDWHWMRTVDLGVKKYTGVDIVAELIKKNDRAFGNSIISFEDINLVTGKLPKADLIFSRDCLVHLSFEDAHRIIANFKRSGAKYLLTTTFPDRNKNSDLIDEYGNELFWRTLNMQIAPFHFPPPIELINEGCTEGNNLFTDKSLGLWLLKDIETPKEYA